MGDSEIIAIFRHFGEVKKSQRATSYYNQLEKVCIYLAIFKIAFPESFRKKGNPKSRVSINKTKILTKLKSLGYNRHCSRRRSTRSPSNSLPSAVEEAAADKILKATLQAINKMAPSKSARAIAALPKNFYTVCLSDPTADFFYSLCDLIRRNALISGFKQQPTYSVAVARSLTNYRPWLASRDFRSNSKAHDCPNDILIREGDRRSIFFWAKEGEIDIAIAPLLENKRLQTIGTLKGSCKLKVALMTDRRVSDETKVVIDWQYLNEKTLIVVDDGFGIIEICKEKAPATTKIEISNSWDTAMASVLASKNVCCIACPSTLPSVDRTRFIETSLEGLDFIEVGVYSFSKRIHGNSVSDEHVEAIAKYYIEQLTLLSEEESDLESLFLELFQGTAHLSLDAKGRRHWVVGQIKNLKIAPNGRLRADHVSNLGGIDFATTLDGKITKKNVGDDKTPTYYLACRFWKKVSGHVTAPDSHVVYLIYNKERFGDFLVGGWIGMPSWYPKSPFLSGLFISGQKARFEDWHDDDYEDLIGKLESTFELEKLSLLWNLSEKKSPEKIKTDSRKRKA